MLHAKSLKVTLVLDANEVSNLTVQDGRPFPGARIKVAGTVIDLALSAKGVRKALAVIRENGAENVAVIVQGKLKITANAVTMEEAGIVAQAKVKAAI